MGETHMTATTSQPSALGIIGGTGLYEIEGLQDIRYERISTPFGEPSDDFIRGRLFGRDLVFLARHGRGHRIQPKDINYRANIYGLKMLNVKWIISVSAVGSMKEEIKPGHIVIPDQLFDRTKTRVSTFFGNGVVAHVGFADPFCKELSQRLVDSARRVGAHVHPSGTYICMEGPAFSTRAESRIYRQWGVDIIGMTALPEAKLAREAEISYGTIALATDYDCWHESEADVTVDAVLTILKQNAEMAKKIVAGVVEQFDAGPECSCHRALQNAIMTDPKLIPLETRRNLALLMDKYGK
jgi:5'-methylthioadenosine phosphorylase